LFFQSKLVGSKSLEKAVATYYSNTPSDKRTNYVNKFKKALKQIQDEKSMGIISDVERNREKIQPDVHTPIENKTKGFIIPDYDKKGNRIEKLGI
jgi:hypothetical protein